MKDSVKFAKILATASAYMQAPFIFVCCVWLCIRLAMWLKSKFNLPDFTLVIGIVLGVLSGFYGMFRHLWLLHRQNENKEKGQNNAE